jgi:hypothetical protein
LVLRFRADNGDHAGLGHFSEELVFGSGHGVRFSGKELRGEAAMPPAAAFDKLRPGPLWDGAGGWSRFG